MAVFPTVVAQLLYLLHETTFHIRCPHYTTFSFLESTYTNPNCVITRWTQIFQMSLVKLLIFYYSKYGKQFEYYFDLKTFGFIKKHII
jgi:hypothetical protein